MLQTDRRNRHHIHPVNWSLTAILLAACGGGGGGGAKPVTNAVILPSGIRQYDVPEGKVDSEEIVQLLTPAERATAATDLTVREVVVNADGLSGRIVYSSPHGDFAADVRVTGVDAHFFHFVKRGTNGEDTTFEFRTPPDYERPLDAGRDNHYDVTVSISIPSNMPYRSFFDDIPGLRIRVTGDADPTPPSESTGLSTLPDGTRRIDIAEGQVSVESASLRATLEAQAGGTIGLTFRNVIVDASGLSGTARYTQDATGAAFQFRISLSGPDATLFTITETGEIRFRAAPDFERPRDTGQDNEYDVTATATGTGLAGQSVNSVVKTRIRVTDLTGDADPSPASDAPLALDVL